MITHVADVYSRKMRKKKQKVTRDVINANIFVGIHRKKHDFFMIINDNR